MAEYLKNPHEEAKRLVTEAGQWIVATVEPRVDWPRTLQTVTFADMEFVLFPNDGDNRPGIALRMDSYGLERNEAKRWIMRLCSALSWSERNGIEIVTWGGGGIPRPIGIAKVAYVTDYLGTEYLPNPRSQSTKRHSRSSERESPHEIHSTLSLVCSKR